MLENTRNVTGCRSAGRLGVALLLGAAVLLGSSPAFARIDKVVLGSQGFGTPSFRSNQTTPLFFGKNTITIVGPRVRFALKLKFPRIHAMVKARIIKRKKGMVRLRVTVPNSTPLAAGRATLYLPAGRNRFTYRFFRRGRVTSIRVNGSGSVRVPLNQSIRVTFRGIFFGRTTGWNFTPLFTNPTLVGAATEGRVVFDVTPARRGCFKIYPYMLADRASPDFMAGGTINPVRDPGNVLHGRRGYLSGRRTTPSASVVVRAAAGQTCPARPPPRPIRGQCPPRSVRGVRNNQQVCLCTANQSIQAIRWGDCP